MIVICLSKQQAVDAGPKAIQQINFTGNLSRKNNEDHNINNNTIMLFIIKEAKESILDFPQGTVKTF